MTLSAVKAASDEDLIEFGLTRKGDRLNLKRLCETRLCENEERIREKKDLLANILERNKSKRKMATSNIQPTKKGSGATSGTKKIQLGWLHFQENNKRYLSIRQCKGGGTREVTLTLNATAYQIIEIAKGLFFPDSVSSFGKEENMSFSLANYQQELITEVLVSGSKLPFTLQRCINSTKLPKVRLYVASKINHDDYLYRSAIEIDDDIEDTRKNKEQKIVLDTNQSTNKTRQDDKISDLETTRLLKAEQDKAYQASLAADQAKEKERLEQLQVHIKEVEQQENLRKARMLRVIDEPEESDDAVLLQVRHVTIGNIKRYFKQSDQMQSVYDWVGSRSLLPMHFELSDFTGHVYLPGESVTYSQNTTLNMAACESTPSLDDSDINWKGFGNASNSYDDTLPLDAIHPVGSHPPEQILVDDGDDLAK
jgi:hypothetical protein